MLAPRMNTIPSAILNMTVKKRLPIVAGWRQILSKKRTVLPRKVSPRVVIFAYGQPTRRNESGPVIISGRDAIRGFGVEDQSPKSVMMALRLGHMKGQRGLSVACGQPQYRIELVRLRWRNVALVEACSPSDGI